MVFVELAESWNKIYGDFFSFSFVAVVGVVVAIISKFETKANNHISTLRYNNKQLEPSLILDFGLVVVVVRINFRESQVKQLIFCDL